MNFHENLYKHFATRGYQYYQRETRVEVWGKDNSTINTDLTWSLIISYLLTYLRSYLLTYFLIYLLTYLLHGAESSLRS